MPTPREIADKKLFEEPLRTFREEIDAEAEKGKTFYSRAINPKVCIRLKDLEESAIFKQAVEDFAKDGITLSYVRDDNEGAIFIKEDHQFVASW